MKNPIKIDRGTVETPTCYSGEREMFCIGCGWWVKGNAGFCEICESPNIVPLVWEYDQGDKDWNEDEEF